MLGKSSLSQTVPDAAQGTYDYTYDGMGNRPSITGYVIYPRGWKTPTTAALESW